MGQMLHWSIPRRAGQLGMELDLQLSVTNSWKPSQAIFAQRLLESMLREAGGKRIENGISFFRVSHQ